MGIFIFMIIIIFLDVIIGCFLRGIGKINEEYDKSFEKYINERDENDEYNNGTGSN